MVKHSFAPAFLARIDEPRRTAWRGASGLEGILAELWSRAQRAWPEIAVPPDVYIDYVAERVGPSASAETALACIDAAELYLTCACGRGDPTALAAFEKLYFDAVIPAALHRMGLVPHTIDEVRQIVWQRFFVAEGTVRPKVDDYAGRGDLRALLRVAATRIAIDLIRKQAKEVPTDDDLLVLPSTADDPELQYVKERHRAEFKVSFQEAVATLPVRDRNLLRMNLLDGLTVEQIGAFYSVHRATVTRWITRARQFLLDETIRLIGARQGIEPDELKHLVSLIQSRLDLSLSRVLK